MAHAGVLAEAVQARSAAEELHSAAQVQAALGRLAQAVRERLAGRDPIILAVMHGGVFTAVELCRRLDFPHQFDYVHVTRYGAGLRGGALRWHVRPKAGLQGRSVLIVDDILDHGATLGALHAALDELGVAERHTAVLVLKDARRPEPRPRVDFCGLTVGDRYVFGCGMDYKGYWRGLPAVYAVAAS